MGISSQSHNGIHLKILPTLLEGFLRHLSYCCRKAFNKAYNKINKFSLNSTSSKILLINQIKKDTFLRTCKSLLNYNRSLNMQFNSFFYIMPQSNSKKVQIFQLINMVNHSGLNLSNVLHEYVILILFFVSEIFLHCKFDHKFY